MTKINPDLYEDYTIEADGWSMTVNTFGKALFEWKNLQCTGCKLFGNKINGGRTLIDSK